MKQSSRGMIATVHYRGREAFDETLVMSLLDFLSIRFAGIFFTISDATNDELVRMLQADDRCKTLMIAAKGAGDARRRAVTAAKAEFPNLSSFQLCDFDRLLTWYDYFPDELSHMSRLPVEKDSYCILGRTPNAFDSHPYAWRVTESLVNQVAEKLFQIDHVDITAGSEIFATSLIDIFLRDNRGRLNDGEWPRIVLANGGKLTYQACDGLCYASRNHDGMSDDPARQLTERLQIAAAITQSLYDERR